MHENKTMTEHWDSQTYLPPSHQQDSQQLEKPYLLNYGVPTV